MIIECHIKKSTVCVLIKAFYRSLGLVYLAERPRKTTKKKKKKRKNFVRIFTTENPILRLQILNFHSMAEIKIASPCALQFCLEGPKSEQEKYWNFEQAVMYFSRYMVSLFSEKLPGPSCSKGG